ncbi:MAG TPA: heme exporter protein CcmD [Alphaproteobacteria bacterium]|jgi:heme exporter protein CcmD|nr:heme exporter protein CcmD [Alphaproteobacteria bacterium]
MSGILRFLEMGGHGGFVWGAYAAVALVLLVLGLISWLDLKRSEGELKRMEARLPGRSRPVGARNRA